MQVFLFAINVHMIFYIFYANNTNHSNVTLQA